MGIGQITYKSYIYIMYYISHISNILSNLHMHIPKYQRGIYVNKDIIKLL